MLVTEPSAGELALLDKLAAEHDIDIAVHNFPKNPADPSTCSGIPMKLPQQSKDAAIE